VLRARFIDFLKSRGPSAIHMAASDRPGVARILNAAQERLLYAKEAGDEGFNGTFAEMVFTVNPAVPYITLPRNVARIEALAACQRPMPVNNLFFEYLQFGNGRMPKLEGYRHFRGQPQAYSRNNVPTWYDLNTEQGGPQYLQAVAVDPADANGPLRVLFQGLDNTGSPIYTQDGNSRVTGEFVTLATPFAQSQYLYTQITGIQKDQTAGPVQIFQIDPVWGIQQLLLTMEPSETTAWYRRYYLDRVPEGCCSGGVVYLPVCGCGEPTPAKLVTAIVKLDLVPVIAQTDYLLFLNIEALIEECMSLYRSSCDDSQAQQDAASHHLNAIRLLIGESSHVNGKNSPAILFKPFGSASLDRLKLTMR
jgi:hypothetical protein